MALWGGLLSACMDSSRNLTLEFDFGLIIYTGEISRLRLVFSNGTNERRDDDPIFRRHTSAHKCTHPQVLSISPRYNMAAASNISVSVRIKPSNDFESVFPSEDGAIDARFKARFAMPVF